MWPLIFLIIGMSAMPLVLAFLIFVYVPLILHEDEIEDFEESFC